MRAVHRALPPYLPIGAAAQVGGGQRVILRRVPLPSQLWKPLRKRSPRRRQSLPREVGAFRASSSAIPTVDDGLPNMRQISRAPPPYLLHGARHHVGRCERPIPGGVPFARQIRPPGQERRFRRDALVLAKGAARPAVRPRMQRCRPFVSRLDRAPPPDGLPVPKTHTIRAALAVLGGVPLLRDLGEARCQRFRDDGADRAALPSNPGDHPRAPCRVRAIRRASPIDPNGAGRADLRGAESAVLRRVPLRGELGMPRLERHVGTTSARLAADTVLRPTADDAVRDVSRGATPPDFPVGEGANRVRGEGSIPGRMPVRCDRWKARSKRGAMGAPAVLRARRDDRIPGVTRILRAAPPDPPRTACGDVRGRELTVHRRVPRRRNGWRGDCERPSRGRRMPRCRDGRRGCGERPSRGRREHGGRRCREQQADELSP
jgi:hypothetical protein